MTKAKNHSSNATASPLPAIRGDSRLDAPFKVSLYLRVSTDRQAKEGDSLDEQESELRKFCDYRGFHIHKTFIESGKSGGNTNRPEYQKLLADIEAKKINAVVVKKLDRLSRSLLDFEQLMTRLQANEVEFISLRENFDTTTAMGKAMLRVALVFAQLEREQTAERIKDVFAYRAEQGLYNGGVRPFGYDSISSELVPHKQERKVIEFIFKLFLELKSTTLVAHECTLMGFKRRSGILWDKREIHKTLKRPVYKGYVQWNNTVFKDIHQPLVTEKVFEQVQELFRQKDFQSPRNEVKGLLKGLLICGHCGSALSPNYTKKKNGRLYYYYRCSSTFNQHAKGIICTRPYLSLEPTHELVLDSLLSYADESRLAQVKQAIAGHNAAIEKEIMAMQIEKERCLSKLDLIKQKRDQYLDSLVTGGFSKDERKKINDRIDDFNLEEKQLEAASYRQEFDIQEREEEKYSAEVFKRMMVSFKVNIEGFSRKELENWVKTHLEKVVIQENNSVVIYFKALKGLFVG